MVSSSVVARLVPYESFPYIIAAAGHTLAGVFAYFCIPETRIWELQDAVEEADAAVESETMSMSEGRGRLRHLMATMLAPFKPLELLWPQQQVGGGRSWNLFLLSSSAFVVMTAVSRLVSR